MSVPIQSGALFHINGYISQATRYAIVLHFFSDSSSQNSLWNFTHVFSHTKSIKWLSNCILNERSSHNLPTFLASVNILEVALSCYSSVFVRCLFIVLICLSLITQCMFTSAKVNYWRLNCAGTSLGTWSLIIPIEMLVKTKNAEDVR